MEGKEFIVVAQKLVQMRSEAAIRSAISRAYYAAFITGRELLLELGFSLSIDASAHEQLYFRLHNAGIPAIKDIADWLKDLRKRRLQADYEMKIRDFHSHTECELHVARAKLIIAQLESCYQQPLRNQLKDGIQEYERKIGLH
jgi:uncharacterized protein (UPF0332 family)